MELFSSLVRRNTIYHLLRYRKSSATLGLFDGISTLDSYLMHNVVTHTHTYIYIRDAFNKFPDFFVLAFKIIVDS